MSKNIAISQNPIQILQNCNFYLWDAVEYCQFCICKHSHDQWTQFWLVFFTFGHLCFIFLDCFCCKNLQRNETFGAINTLPLCAPTHLLNNSAQTNLFPPVVMTVLMFLLLPQIFFSCLLRQPVSPALWPLFSALAPVFSNHGHEDATKTPAANTQEQGIFHLLCGI